MSGSVSLRDAAEKSHRLEEIDREIKALEVLFLPHQSYSSLAFCSIFLIFSINCCQQPSQLEFHF